MSVENIGTWGFVTAIEVLHLILVYFVGCLSWTESSLKGLSKIFLPGLILVAWPSVIFFVHCLIWIFVEEPVYRPVWWFMLHMFLSLGAYSLGKWQGKREIDTMINKIASGESETCTGLLGSFKGWWFL